jgi:hypothetical protein
MTLFCTIALASWLHVTAYTFDDALRDIVPGRNGRAAMLKIAGVIDRTSVHVTRNAETDEFFSFLSKTLDKFDFMKLYKSRYCTPTENGFCGVTLQGCGGDQSYSVVLQTPSTVPCPMTRLWDFRTEYALKRNEHNTAGGQSFIVSVTSTTATGSYSHRNAMAFVGSVLRVLDPDNIRSMRAPEAPVFTAVTGDARGIVNEFHRSFPRVSSLFNNYADIRSLAKIKSHRGISFTHCELRYGYRMKDLAEGFPLIAKSLNDIKDLYRITMDVKNRSGNTVLYIVFDSGDDVFSISFYTRHGKLVPCDAARDPVFGEEFAPASLTDYSYRAVMGMVHTVHGLKFTTPSATVSFSYRDAPSGGYWRMKLDDISRTVITGSYYNFIPPWLIDAFIPGDMEQLIYDFSRVLRNGNDGKGAGISFDWDTRNRDNVMLHFRAFAEFMDNQFLRYGLRVWSKKTIGDKKLGEEVKKLQSLLVSAFTADLKAGKR